MFLGLLSYYYREEGWKRRMNREPPSVVSDSSNVLLKALPHLAQEDSGAGEISVQGRETWETRACQGDER